jgi:hypothetical protein
MQSLFFYYENDDERMIFAGLNEALGEIVMDKSFGNVPDNVHNHSSNFSYASQ